MQTIFAKSETPNRLAMNIPSSTFTTAEPVENGNTNRALVDALVSSKTYRDYERAFGDLTGLPVALQPVETWQLPHHGKRNENEFCSLLSKKKPRLRCLPASAGKTLPEGGRGSRQHGLSRWLIRFRRARPHE